MLPIQIYTGLSLVICMINFFIATIIATSTWLNSKQNTNKIKQKKFELLNLKIHYCEVYISLFRILGYQNLIQSQKVKAHSTYITIHYNPSRRSLFF